MSDDLRERLDLLVDTDPLTLLNEALHLLYRAEQAEADLAQVNKYLVSGGVTRTGAQGVLDLLHMLAAEQERHRVARQEWKRCLALLRQAKAQQGTPPTATECPAWAWHACACPQQCEPEPVALDRPEGT